MIIGRWMFPLVVMACSLFALASAQAAGGAEGLYDRYEALNTPENLGIEFAGGKPPAFVEEQIQILYQINKMPRGAALPVVRRILDEYARRVEALGQDAFQRSVLQALQLHLAALMTTFIDDQGVLDRADAFVKSPLTKEYARGRVLAALARKKMEAIQAKDDPEGARRGAILLDVLIGSISFSDLMHAPARLNGMPDLAPSVAGTPLAFRSALAPAAQSLPARYAADCGYTLLLFRKQTRDKQDLNADERKALLDVARQWVDEYRPLVRKEDYPSDVLGRALPALAGCKGNDAVAVLLRKNGVEVTPYVEGPPSKPGPSPR